MENNDISLSDKVLIKNRRHWKQAYFTMRGWAFVLAATSILLAIGFGYAMFRPRTIQPDIAYEIIPGK